MDVCTDYHFLSGILYVKMFIKVALIVVPLIIIILGMYDGFKAIMSGNQDDIKKIALNVARRVSIVAIVLLLPTVLNIIFSNLEGFSDTEKRISLCYQNADSNTIAGLKRARLKELKEANIKESEEYIVSYNKEKLLQSKAKATSNADTSVSGQGNFQKFSLSDGQVTSLAALASQEQGTPKGAAAEASLMANLFELKGSTYGTGADGLINYVRNGGWFAKADHYMQNPNNVDQTTIDAVRKVLVEGKRTLPAYVDEHDCFSDIVSATNNGAAINVSDRSAYQKNVTAVHNIYKSDYTFYSFPDTASDPFGYTSEDNRTKLGDDCYSFDNL